MGDDVECHLLDAVAVGVWLLHGGDGHELVDAVADEDPPSLAGPQQIEFVGFVLEAQISLHNQTYEDVEQTGVEEEEVKDEVCIPRLVLSEVLDVVGPRFGGHHLVHQRQGLEDIGERLGVIDPVPARHRAGLHGSGHLFMKHVIVGALPQLHLLQFEGQQAGQQEQEHIHEQYPHEAL